MENATTQENIFDSAAKGAHKVFLVGLGTVGLAIEGAEKLIDTLSKKGAEMEPKTRESLRRAGESICETIQTAKKEARETWREAGDDVRDFKRKSEQMVDEKISSAMRKAGVPTRDEIAALMDRIDELARKIDSFQAGQQPAEPANPHSSPGV